MESSANEGKLIFKHCIWLYKYTKKAKLNKYESILNKFSLRKCINEFVCVTCDGGYTLLLTRSNSLCRGSIPHNLSKFALENKCATVLFQIHLFAQIWLKSMLGIHRLGIHFSCFSKHEKLPESKLVTTKPADFHTSDAIFIGLVLSTISYTLYSSS